MRWGEGEWGPLWGGEGGGFCRQVPEKKAEEMQKVSESRSALGVRFRSAFGLFCVAGLGLSAWSCGGQKAARANSVSGADVTSAVAGAERGEADDGALVEPLEGPAELRVRVDLGTSPPLPSRSKLLVEVADVSDKDAPRPIAERKLDVSGQEGIIEVSVPLEGSELRDVRSLSITGRIDTRKGMIAISTLPLVVAGPFENAEGTLRTPEADSFALELGSVPSYESPELEKRKSAPSVAPVRQVDTGNYLDVPGPDPK